MILFSLPVHEKPEIVRDQVENIRYFCPEALICIHVSSGATVDKDEFRRQCDLENVFVNPSSYETIWCEGLMHTHVSNFLHALEQGRRFDKVVLLSSNELLVKPGLAAYVADYSIGSQTEIYDTATDWGSFRSDVLSAIPMRKFLSRLDMKGYFGGQAEGQFYDTKIFAHITRMFIDHFPMAPCGFPSEEVIPPTIAAHYAMNGMDAALPITFCDYCTNLAISTEIIDQIRAGTGTVYARRYLKALRSPHMGICSMPGVFSVKRIPREDCDLRRYVRSLMV
ncbi:hypothetical protein [Ferranicluibacter rubi]|uniref:Uncharacterized protein n=1 Tax=Ferranicluibacter rubi TaxID=2715133 RepID=A0AA43ZI57_9HYPH|nr:hypothetical protein [Ferranicluibacter rubi]NHT78327.1 hypothetical protein [Ferranicluibacter rubi]TCP85042.1 hypothetical protein C8J31_1078 [Rhizobium sp. PP-CC-2G-626]TCQ27569.1 hypothetical protein C8J33_101192 [Rhizobium sp. PP-CC-3G-465]